MSKKSAKKILLLHGALGCQNDLSSLKEYLEQHGYETLSFDFSGHGSRPQRQDNFRIESFAQELEEYLHTQALKNIIVFGYSMGGYVALFHKANFENSPISQIITYGTKFNWSEQAVAKELPMLDPDYLIEKFPSFAKSLQSKHGEKWKHLLRLTAHMMQNLERLDGLTQEDLEDLSIPVTLIVGELDRMVTQQETTRMASWLTHGQMKILAQSKHELERASIKDLALTIDSVIE